MKRMKIKIKEIGYRGEFEDLITLNDDIEIDEMLKEKIIKTPKNELLEVVKVISSPIKIESVEIYNEEFLLKDF